METRKFTVHGITVDIPADMTDAEATAELLEDMVELNAFRFEYGYLRGQEFA